MIPTRAKKSSETHVNGEVEEPPGERNRKRYTPSKIPIRQGKKKETRNDTEREKP